MASKEQRQPSEQLNHVEKVWKSMQPNSPIYDFLLSDVEILSSSETGSITAQLRVRPCHLNSKNTLHGTVSACITDWAGSMCVAATGREKVGASTDIHTSFISTAREGDLLRISARAAKVGGTLAFTTVDIEKIGNNGESAIVTTGSHTKYVKQ